jgi:hypothetical protein
MAGSWVAVALVIEVLGAMWLWVWRGEAPNAAPWLGYPALALIFSGWHVDDAGIVFAAARALAEGQGLSPAPWAPAVEAFSDPLWVVLLAAGQWIGVPVMVGAKLAQWVLGLATVGLAMGASGLTGRWRAAVGATVATSGPFVLWSTSGLEVSLFAAVLMAVVVVGRQPHRWADVLGIGLIALGAWCRPEGGLAAAGVWWVVRGRSGASSAIAGVLMGTVSLLVVRGLWLETWLPNSVVAKWPQPGLWTFARGVAYVTLSSVLAGWAAWFAPWVRSRAWAPLAVAAGAATFAAGVGGDWMGYARFFAPYVPVVITLGAAALVVAPRWWAVGAGLSAFTLAYAAKYPTLPIDHGLRRGALYAEVGGSACGSPSVATPDVGGVLFYWPEVRILDLAGLIDREAATHRRHSGYWSARLEVDRPAIVDLHGGWAQRTGLSDEVMTGLDYRLLCRRGTEDASPTLWLDARCAGPVSERGQHWIDNWCAFGSGVRWSAASGIEEAGPPRREVIGGDQDL